MEYILVKKTHRKSNPFDILYEERDCYFEKMISEHGLQHVSFSDLEIPLSYNLFKVVDKFKALKFAFDHSEYIQKPEKFSL